MSGEPMTDEKALVILLDLVAPSTAFACNPSISLALAHIERRLREPSVNAGKVGMAGFDDALYAYGGAFRGYWDRAESEAAVADKWNALRILYADALRAAQPVAECKGSSAIVKLLENYQSNIGARRPDDRDDAAEWDRINDAVAILTDKPASDPPGAIPTSWFCFDGNDYSEFDTEAAARDDAERALECFADDAADGWDEAVTNIRWGVVYGRVVESDRRPSTPDDPCHPNCGEYVEYEIYDSRKKVGGGDDGEYLSTVITDLTARGHHACAQAVRAAVADTGAMGGDDRAEESGFYLASFKGVRHGDEQLWWRANNAGYTHDLHEAGIYTEIVPGYHDSEHTVPVPVEYVNRANYFRRVLNAYENKEFHDVASLRKALSAQPAGEA